MDSDILAKDAPSAVGGGISVIMPVYDQAAFISRALVGLQAQTYDNWELTIIDDGSKDNLEEVLSPFLSDGRIRCLSNETNRGLGYSLNRGLDSAGYDLVAYLPADDIYHRDHLRTLIDKMEETGADLVYSGVLYDFNDQSNDNYGSRSEGKVKTYPLQLVQVLHRRTEDRWMERSELATDDLGRMFWDKFTRKHSKIEPTGKVTCQWVDHMYQRHKIMNDRGRGGIYMYKRYYGVKEPIRFQSSVGNYIDELERFENFRKPPKESKEKGLKILLVGELAYNPERICALEERGHKLYGLWISNPLNFNTIGPLPFGNVEDVPFDGWVERVKEIKPDVIYALLNYQAIPLAHHVLTNNPGIPFVWHFKEGPFYCRAYGMWNQLVELYSRADGRIYTNRLLQEWFGQFIPNGGEGSDLILDGDLPKKDWFSGERTPLLSEQDGQIHTVIAGRPLGLSAYDIKQMADQGIHLHIYGDIFHNQSGEMLKKAAILAPDHLHLHPNCPQQEWVKEFSQYDAGWLHYFKSDNDGELLRASWNDLNSPARMSTYAIAGLPMIMYDNTGHRVAFQEYLESNGMALKFRTFPELGELLANKAAMTAVRDKVWADRDVFSFDRYADDLVAFFRTSIKKGAENKILQI